MLYKKTRKPKLIYKRRATDILYDKMMFYSGKAATITNALVKFIQNNQQARGDLLVQLHKEMHRFNAIAIDCASKLAPYQSPKLETIEVHNKVTRRYVVVAPKSITDVKDWLAIVNRDQKLLAETKPSLIKPDFIDVDSTNNTIN